MPQARLLVFGAALLTLAVPGHPLGMLPGLPLGLAGIVVALLIVGWLLALPVLPPRSGILIAALVGLGALKVSVALLAPAYGLAGTYRYESATATSPGLNRDADAVSTDTSLDFRGDTFPVHFFNDIRRFNFYTANDLKRDLLPFSAVWSGQFRVPAAGRYTVTLESNGPATLDLGAGMQASVEQSGRVRASPLTVDLPAGLVPLRVTYVRPPEAMPWLVVRAGPDGAAADVLAAPMLLREGVSASAVDRDAWLRPVGLAIDGALLVVLGVWFGWHALTVARASRRSLGVAELSPLPSPRVRGGSDEGCCRLSLSERLLLAAYVILGVGRELLLHLHLFGKTVILSGGNDWLAYEGFARDVLTTGPLLTDGKALGQGPAYYYQPLYIYWVALTHALLGESLFGPLFMNAVLGVAAGCLLFLLTRELFGRGAAVVAVILFEAYRETVFAPTAGLLLSENLLIPLVPLMLLLLVRAARTGRLVYFAWAGVVLGLAGLTRTTPLALLLPALLTLALALRRLGVGRTAATVRLAVLVVACILTVSPATIRNYVVSGRPVLITSSAGANLWEAHRPSARVDLSGVDRDPLYERLGLDRQTREVAEYARQDPAGYLGSMAPMFLYAVGVVGAIAGTREIHPGLLGMWIGYLLVVALSRRARALPTWFLHAFLLSHLAAMTVFFSHQYGFRLILPMYVTLVPFVAWGIASVGLCAGHLLAKLTRRSDRVVHSAPTVAVVASPLAPWQRPAATYGAVIVVILLIATTYVGWRSPQAMREAFYGLNGDAALATHQALRPDLMAMADSVYFVGDDSRSTDVAYLRGLAFPALRWFDGARGLVLPPPGQQAAYVLPDRAAADLAKRCIGDDTDLGPEVDSTTGLGVDVRVASEASGACTDPRLAVNATFADTGRLTGLDAPASIEPGKTMDVLLYWQTSARPSNRARPFVRLVDGRGRRWGQAESAAYPSSAWRLGERVIGLARLDIEQTLPPGEYRLDTGFTLGTGQARLAEDGDPGVAGQTEARAGPIKLVSRSTPLAPRSLPIKIPLDATFDGARLLGAALDRDAPRAGERVRLTLFWQNAGGRLTDRDGVVVARDGAGAVMSTWRHQPVDGGYPARAWKPSEVVRDTWDLVLPPTLPAGPIELAVAMAPGGTSPDQYVSVTTLNVQSIERRLARPETGDAVGQRFVGGAEIVSADLKPARARAGDQIDMTLLWRAATSIGDDYEVTIGLLDEAGRPIVQQDGEPSGGRRPTSGWTIDEYVDDSWRLRLPREMTRGRYRVSVGLVSVSTGLPIRTESGDSQTLLPIELVVE